MCDLYDVFEVDGGIVIVYTNNVREKLVKTTEPWKRKSLFRWKGEWYTLDRKE